MKKQILTLALILSAMFVSANTSYTINPLYNHTITLSEGAVMTKAFRTNTPGTPILSNVFTKAAIQSLLDQPGCAGIRDYNAIDANGVRTLVKVGVDSDGNDMVGTGNIILDRALHCPPSVCSSVNPLNTD
jgi:hypothetical protein